MPEANEVRSSSWGIFPKPVVYTLTTFAAFVIVVAGITALMQIGAWTQLPKDVQELKVESKAHAKEINDLNQRFEISMAARRDENNRISTDIGRLLDSVSKGNAATEQLRMSLVEANTTALRASEKAANALSETDALKADLKALQLDAARLSK